MSITKSIPSSTRYLIYNQGYDSRFGYQYGNVPYTGGGRTITYEDGPKYVGQHCNWKRCTQYNDLSVSPLLRWDISGTYSATCRFSGYCFPDRIAVPELPARPVNLDQELWDNFYSDLDLNTEEAVMAYSAIIQAVPLLGGLAKANRVLNSIGRWATRSLRKRPFTEVVKQAIQADFINRFVIQTTLQDLRMVQDSTDYVLRTIRHAQERNHALTSIKVDASDTRHIDSGSGSMNIYYPFNSGDGLVSVNYDFETSVSTKASLFVLADVKYDVDAISPLKLWAARVGLTRPLESVWDLVPFSFVIDYFARAGDFLTHLSEKMSSQEGLKGKILSMHGAWTTYKVESRASAHATSTSYYANRYRFGRSPLVEVSTDDAVASRSTFTRSPADTQITQSSFWDRSGLISPHLSFVRARTLAELYIQAKLR